jgi:hypothetical protein
MRMRYGIALLALASVAGVAAGSDLVRVISGVDCVDARNFVAEFDPAPANVTYMRVQHVGDPDTPELAGEVANVVTWDVGRLTGLSLPPSSFAKTQRGFRDQAGSSAFQLACESAGFFLNSRTFSHTKPLVLAGPSVSIARNLVPGAAVFRNATSAITLEASVRIPVMLLDAPPVVEATAQVSFVYYVQDTTTGTAFAHVIALFDNRPAGVNGAGAEAVTADAYTAFVTSPLASRVPAGTAPAFVSVGASSSSAQFDEPWAEPRAFRALVSYPQFKAMLASLARDALLDISPRPEDYRVTLFGVLGEIFPGTDNSHEVLLGASVARLALSETYRAIAPVAVVEFEHAGLDRYFVTARPDEIEALDSGRLPGWARTGASFLAWPAFVQGTIPVCRYYLPPAFGDSHFFSGSARECSDVAKRFPEFVLEDPEAMFVAMPDVSSGACPSSTKPVYRLWNARGAANHRYTTDAGLRQTMIAAGWMSEGYGPSGVAMCAALSAAAG